MEQKQSVSGGAKALAIVSAIVVGIALAVVFIIWSLSGVFKRSGIKALVETSVAFESEFAGYERQVTYYMISDLGLDREFVNEELKSLWVSVITDVAEYAVTGKGDPVNVKSAMKIVKKNKKAIEKELGESITNDELDEIQEKLELMNDNIKDSVSFDGLDSDIKTFKKFRSGSYAIIPLIIAVAGIVGIFTINKGTTLKALGLLGISGIISGVICAIAKLLMNAVTSNAGTTPSDQMVVAMINIFSKGLVFYMILSLVAGVALIVISKVGNKKEA